MSPDVTIVASVSPKEDYEKLDHYNTIDMFKLKVVDKQLEVDASKSLLAERDLRILELERKNVEKGW